MLRAEQLCVEQVRAAAPTAVLHDNGQLCVCKEAVVVRRDARAAHLAEHRNFALHRDQLVVRQLQVDHLDRDHLARCTLMPAIHLTASMRAHLPVRPRADARLARVPSRHAGREQHHHVVSTWLCPSRVRWAHGATAPTAGVRRVPRGPRSGTAGAAAPWAVHCWALRASAARAAAAAWGSCSANRRSGTRAPATWASWGTWATHSAA